MQIQKHITIQLKVYLEQRKEKTIHIYTKKYNTQTNQNKT